MRVAVTTTGSACTVGVCAATGGTARAAAIAAATTDRVGSGLIIGVLVAGILPISPAVGDPVSDLDPHAERRTRRAKLLRLRVRRIERIAPDVAGSVAEELFGLNTVNGDWNVAAT